MQLRVHHILCAPLFVGKGYSEAFVRNMAGIVQGIEENASITLQTTPDVICAECPNLVGGKCRLDGNHVVSKDEDLLHKLSIAPAIERPAKEVFTEIAQSITEEIFEESCHNCNWYRQGLCSYTLYKKNLKRFL